LESVVQTNNRHWVYNKTTFDTATQGYDLGQVLTLKCQKDYFFRDQDTSKISEITVECDSSKQWAVTSDDVQWNFLDTLTSRCIHDVQCTLGPGTEANFSPVYTGDLATITPIDGNTLYSMSDMGDLVEVGDGSKTVSCLKTGKFSEDLYAGTMKYLAIVLESAAESDGSFEYLEKRNTVIIDDHVSTVSEVFDSLRAYLADNNLFVPTNSKRFRRLSAGRTLVQTKVLAVTDSPSLDLSGSTLAGLPAAVRIASATYVLGGACSEIKEETSRGSYHWLGTANDNKECKFGDGSQTCEGTCDCDEEGLCILETDYTNCPFESETTNTISDIEKSNDSAMDKAQKLDKATEEMSEETLDEDGYSISANVIQNILSGIDSSEGAAGVADNIFNVVDRFANAKKLLAYKDAVATEKYLTALDTVLGAREASKPITGTNIKGKLIPEIPKDGAIELETASDGSIEETGEAGKQKGAEIAVSIPFSFADTLGQLGDDNRFYFVVFEKDTFFTTMDMVNGKVELQSKVFSIGITKRDSIRSIQPRVRFSMKRMNGSVNSSRCVYWQDSSDGIRDRTIMDVTTVSVTADEVICETDHMTSFAILMSSEPLPEVHEKILRGITYVLCSLSIIGLLMSLIGLSVFRVIRKPVATKVHINLSAALLMGNLVFLIGVDQTAEESGSPIPCLISGVLTHYFLLAAFFWMAVEGIHLYVMIVRVFGHLSTGFLVKCAVASWGMPLVIVAATLAWDPNNYNTNLFCWLNQIPMIAMFLSPVMVIIMINTWLFVRVTQEISKSQNRMRNENLPSTHCRAFDIRQQLTKVRASVSIMVLLGLTWITGPLMLIEDLPLSVKLAISYLFTVCNAIQGFLFFFFHCAIKTDVKERWKTYLGFDLSQSKMTSFSKSQYEQQQLRSRNRILSNAAVVSSKPKSPEFHKLGDSVASSLNKSLVSFKPTRANKVKPGSASSAGSRGTRAESPEYDSDLNIMDF